MKSEDLPRLAAPFPREAVSWRAQNVANDGTRALALAYIDARDVMNRLDEVCGPENWESAIEETAKGRVLATIRIKIDGMWVSKCDGAGATDIEGDKGGISDALKRAAVQWGIGRYLYDIVSPWVPCKSYKNERTNKFAWQSWTDDPWKFVKNAPAEPEITGDFLIRGINGCDTFLSLQRWWEQHAPTIKHHPDIQKINAAKDARKAEINLMDKAVA